MNDKKTYSFMAALFLLIAVNEYTTVPYFNIIMGFLVTGGGASLRHGISKIQNNLPGA